jgi:hypothetical protein
MDQPIVPADDYLHTPTDHPLWNESGWFSVSVPERDIHGFIHTGHRPNMNMSLCGIGLYDPSGDEVYDCLYYDYGTPAPLNATTNTEMWDYTDPNSLTLRCLEPLKRFSIRYDRGGCVLDLEWNATMAPFNAGFPPGSEGWGPCHYEQAGRMTGIIRVEGSEYAIDCGSNHDRSWGPRDYQNRSEADFPRHDFPWFNDGRGYAMNMYTLPTVAPLDDPVIGMTDRAIGGWIQRDEKVARIVSGTRAAVERRADGVPSVVVVEGTDELDRSFHAEGRVASVLKWTGLPGMLVFWSGVEWRLDDGRTIWGETGEVFTGGSGRRFLRSLPR